MARHPPHNIDVTSQFAYKLTPPIDSVSQRNGGYSLNIEPAQTDSELIQTKDFVKFLSLVVILYLGWYKSGRI